MSGPPAPSHRPSTYADELIARKPATIPNVWRVPPAGFEPALPENRETETGGTVTGGSTLPDVLRAKLDELEERSDV